MNLNLLSRLESTPRRALLGLGLASALVYLLAFTLPYWLPPANLSIKEDLFASVVREPWRGVLFYVALGLLFGFYLLAYRLALRVGQPRLRAQTIALWTLVFGLLLVPVQPITSSDVYAYVFQGRIVAVLGENPFAHIYRDFAGDPFYFLVTFHNLPAAAGYGPLWIAVESGLGWLAANRLALNLLLFKGLGAGLHLAGALLVYATLRRRAPEQSVAGMLFYAWNPLLLLEVVANAHNDAAMAALALAGFYLLIRQRWWAAVPCLAAAALIKPVALLWLPLAAVWAVARLEDWPARLRRAAAIVLLALLPVALAYAPFWAGALTWQGVLAQSNIHGNSLASLIIWLLASVWPGARTQIVQGVKLATTLIFAPFFLLQLAVARRCLVRAAFDVMLVYLLLVGLQFMPWYATWLLVPAALSGDALRRRLALVLCILAPLIYFPFGVQWARGHLPVWAIAFLSAVPLLGLGAWWAVRAWRIRRLA